MDDYFWLKLVHIVSSTVLFGTGLGTAFFFWMAHRSGNVAAIAVTARHVVLADFWFTTPAVFVQPLTGWLLLERLHLPLSTPFVVASIALYLLAGACWLPVVWMQMQARDLAVAAHATNAPLPPRYFALMRWWFALGWPAFIATLLIFWLMIFKTLPWYSQS